MKVVYDGTLGINAVYTSDTHYGFKDIVLLKINHEMPLISWIYNDSSLPFDTIKANAYVNSDSVVVEKLDKSTIVNDIVVLGYDGQVQGLPLLQRDENEFSQLLQRQLNGLVLLKGCKVVVKILNEIVKCWVVQANEGYVDASTKCYMEKTSQRKCTMTNSQQDAMQQVMRHLETSDLGKEHPELVNSYPGIEQLLKIKTIVLNGYKGAGKSLVIKNVADKLKQKEQLFVSTVDAEDWLEKCRLRGDFEPDVACIEKWVNVPKDDKVLVLVIDNVDRLFQKEDGSSAGSMGKLVLQYVEEVKGVLLGTATEDSIPADVVIQLQAPDANDRCIILEQYVPKDMVESKQWCRKLADTTGGYLPVDLKNIVRSAYLAAGTRCERDVVVEWNDLVQAKLSIPPSLLLDFKVSAKVGKPVFAGYEELQNRLHQLVSWKFGQQDNVLGVSNVSGIVFHGPSGVGKSYLANCIAASCNANFVNVKATDLLSKYLGETEATIRKLFSSARNASPCILFFDELDALAMKRSFDANDSDGNNLYTRILSTLLNELDGIEDTSKSNLLVVAATNRLDSLDPALIRPGRIDMSIEIHVPTYEDRLAIFRYAGRKLPIEDTIDFELLAKDPRVDGMTGSDIVSIMNSSAILSLREDIENHSIAARHVDEAIHDRVGTNARIIRDG